MAVMTGSYARAMGRWATPRFKVRSVAWAAVVAALLGLPAVAVGHDTPHGFWYGTDSAYMQVRGSGTYQEPVISGAYGGYTGMAGSWEWWLGCPGRFLDWSKINAAQADTNLGHGLGVGTGAYWFMGGPGVDPHYDGTVKEATSWGMAQAKRALADIRNLPPSRRVTYPILWMDIELPGISPAPDNGWDSVYTSPCSGAVKQSFVPAAVDRADFNGFWGWVNGHSSFRPGVYSAPDIWSRIFGTGSTASIPGTFEWTYEPETSNVGQAPSGWCLHGGGCAQFFGGQTSGSSHALMWQWSGGGGVRNGYGDFDQIAGNRTKVRPS
jgi:hypothetical protein